MRGWRKRGRQPLPLLGLTAALILFGVTAHAASPAQGAVVESEQTTDENQGEAAAVQETDQSVEDQGLEGLVVVRDVESGEV